jgi:hypothetical protein
VPAVNARGGWAALAALGLAVGGAGGACTDEAGEDDEVRRSGEGGAVVELLTSSRRTVEALSVESSVTGTEMLGMTDAMAMPVADRDEARAQADAAIEGLVAAVEDHEDQAGPYAPALDALDGVAALREEADGLAGPGGFANIDASQSLADRYAEVVDTVEAATGELAGTVEDTDLARGATLYATALEQSTLEAEVARTVLLTSVVGDGGLDSPEEIETVATHLSEMIRARAALEESARGPYQEPAQALTAQLDVSALLSSVEVPAGQGWTAFLDRVEQILVEG